MELVSCLETLVSTSQNTGCGNASDLSMDFGLERPDTKCDVREIWLLSIQGVAGGMDKTSGECSLC